MRNRKAAEPAVAPESLCILRTSAIGDVTHVVPLIHTLQAAWPQTRLTWVIGKLEYRVVGDLPGVGNLFKTRSRTANKQEMLVFITPKMIADKAAVR